MKQGGCLTFAGTDRAIARANRRLVAFVTGLYTKGFNGAMQRSHRSGSFSSLRTPQDTDLPLIVWRNSNGTKQKTTLSSRWI